MPLETSVSIIPQPLDILVEALERSIQAYLKQADLKIEVYRI